MVINNFSGGMMAGIPPEKLKPDQAVCLINMDMTAGHLRPLKKPATPYGTSQSWMQSRYAFKGTIYEDNNFSTFFTIHDGRLYKCLKDGFFQFWHVSMGQWVDVCVGSPNGVFADFCTVWTPANNGGLKGGNASPLDNDGRTEVECDEEAVHLEYELVEDTSGAWSTIPIGTYRYSLWLTADHYTWDYDVNTTDVKIKNIEVNVSEAFEGYIRLSYGIVDKDWLYDEDGSYMNNTDEQVLLLVRKTVGELEPEILVAKDLATPTTFNAVYNENPSNSALSEYESSVTGYIEAGSYQYAATRVSLATGYESPPTLTNIFRMGANSWCVVRIDAPPYDYHYTVRVYRMGGLSDVWQYVGEAEYSSDNGEWWLQDFNHSNRLYPKTLETTNCVACPTPQVICSYNDMLFVAYGNIVRFSVINNPSQFDKFAWFSFKEDVTALASTDNGIVVFTATSTSLIIGTDKADMFRTEIDSRLGCPAPWAWDYFGNTIVFMSNDGLCIKVGNKVRLITQKTIPNLIIPLNNADHPTYDNLPFLQNQNDTYYAYRPVYTVSHLVVIDETVWLRDFGRGRLLGYNLRNGKQVFHINYEEGIYSLIKSDKKELLYIGGMGYNYALNNAKYNQNTDWGNSHYLSPPYTDGNITVWKKYDNFKISHRGHFNLSIRIDDVDISVFNFTQPMGAGVVTEEFRLPVDNSSGYYIQFAINNLQGEIFSIEYDVLQRQGDH